MRVDDQVGPAGGQGAAEGAGGWVSGWGRGAVGLLLLPCWKAELE